MSLSLANAITQVRYALNESTAAFWTDAEITAWVQEGSRIFASKTLLVEASDDIDPLKANQLAYTSADETWIADILEPYAAIYYDTSNNYKGLIKVHPRMLGNTQTFTAGEPKYYCLHNRKLYVWPLTTAAIVSIGKISVLYAKETDDITVIPDEFQHLPVIYAIGKAKQKDQKFAEATNLISQFFQEMDFERADKSMRESDAIADFKIKTQRGQGQQ